MLISTWTDIGEDHKTTMFFVNLYGNIIDIFSLFLYKLECHFWKWQPTPVFLPGESQGWWSLVGCCLWGRTESDTTEVT